MRSLNKKGDKMSEINNTPGDSNDKYFLQEQELWENLGFDWEGWNAAVEKILQQKSAASKMDQE